MAFYRKKPVVIEAQRVPDYDPEHTVTFLDECLELSEWCGGVCRMMLQEDEHGGPRIDIETLEGTMQARSGDWIIKGVKGEFYPCKPDIFEATYEPAGVYIQAGGV